MSRLSGCPIAPWKAQWKHAAEHREKHRIELRPAIECARPNPP
jgi:hypothetical protein